MSTLSREQVAGLVLAGGLKGEAAAIAVAIGQPESGYQYDVMGDRALMTGDWGPSIGIWQIRSLKSHALSGDDRDGAANFDPTHNMRSMLTLSGGGTNWHAWTTYNSGAYLASLPAARAALLAPASIPPNLPMQPHWSDGTPATAKELQDALGVTPDKALASGPGGWQGFVNSLSSGAESIPGVSGVMGAVSGAVDATQSVGDFLGKLGNVNLWKRAAVMATGVAALIGGAVLIFKLDMRQVIAAPAQLAPETTEPKEMPDGDAPD